MSRFGRVLLVIVAVAFGIRVAYVAIAKAGPCPLVLADALTARRTREQLTRLCSTGSTMDDYWGGPWRHEWEAQ